MCKHSKRSHFKKQEVFQLFLLLDPMGSDISINFVTSLYFVNGINAICKTISPLLKKRYHITTRKKINTKRIVDLFFDYVLKFHRLLRSIILDQSTKFINNFLKFLYKKLSINLKLSTVWYLEIDSQTKWLKQVIEYCFMAYVNYLQNYWHDRLKWTLFVSYIIKFKITKVSLFFANKYFHL